MSAPKLEHGSVAAVSYRDQNSQLLIRVFARGQDQQLHSCTFDEHTLLWQWTTIPPPPNNNTVLKVLGAATFKAGPQFVVVFVHVVPDHTILAFVSQEGLSSGWQPISKAQTHLACSEMGVVTYDDNGSPHVYGLCTTDGPDLIRVHGHFANNVLVIDETNEGKPGGNTFPVSGRPAAIAHLSADQIPQHQIEVYAVCDVPFSGNQLSEDARLVSNDVKNASSTWVWSILGVPVDNKAQPVFLSGAGVAADFYSLPGLPGRAFIYTVGVDGNLWLFSRPPNWKSLGHPQQTQVTGTPSVISYPATIAGLPSELEDVFVNGLDGSLYTHSGNGPWVSLGNPGTHLAPPCAIAIPQLSKGFHTQIPVVQVFCVGDDNSLYASLKQSQGNFLWSTQLGA